MTKEETNPGGLLSKVVRFVKNPTVSWQELDSLDDRESQYSKQMLKEMIERKRRNDFVRRREFDQLRKLRRREVLQGHRTEDPTNRPSFFQSSMASSDDRAVTLKKIDEIEAQMSQQWWKGKQGAEESTGPGALSEPGVDGMSDTEHSRAYAPTEPGSLPAPMDGGGKVGNHQAPAFAPPPPVQPLFADDSMAIGRFGGVDAQLAAGPSNPGGMASLSTAANPAPAPEPEEFVHEPDLEEAAIRFANGDHAGAEAGLMDVLALHQQDDPEQQLEIWMTLFDLYRATGQHERFDTLAIDFAAQFSRSAPLWFSIPEQLGMVDAPVGDAAATVAASARREFSWNAPGTLAVSSVAALQASLARAAAPWTLSWSRITAIDEAAVPLLADQFTRWADKDGQIVFSGVEKLNALLESKTQSGDRSSSTEWWRLRMAALRLMGRADEFELVALDYCVTYEVSPPSWVSPRCGYSDNEGVVSGAAPLTVDSDFLATDLGDNLSAPGLPDAEPAAQLSGHIEGDAVPLLQPFEALCKPGVPLTIACDRLIRVDFAAAGAVLNWAAEQQGRGYEVRFQNLHRLVAIFFNVIGINEHAWVVPRKN
ncbi:MAG: STAS domain-containing protein [Acidovorax sp.]|uniref:STAS domain-containing protein n=1 Tax=Acidovorax sp. TaxID=1872122 RepID=UPI0039E51170